MKFTKVKKIKKVESEPVYHLNVKNNQSFFGENLCLHNCNYRGEIKILLHNFDINNTVKIRHGDRIAQAVINNVFSENQLYFNKKNNLDETNRGSSGFGDSGYK